MDIIIIINASKNNKITSKCCWAGGRDDLLVEINLSFPFINKSSAGGGGGNYL